MKIHQLKIWPVYLDAILDGKKMFEVRLNDRGFEVGDVLILKKWDPMTQKYGGFHIAFKVDYVLHLSDLGVPNDVDGEFCVMGLGERIKVTGG